MERFRRNAPPLGKPCRDRSRDRENLADVSGEQVPVCRMDQLPAGAFLGAPLPLQRRAERVPSIVVLPHRVVQPDHVIIVADGIAGIAQRDDLIDAASVVRQADVGQPGRQIGGALTSESVLRRQDEVRFVAFFTKRLDESPGHHQMTSLDEPWSRRDDRDRLHFAAGAPARLAPSTRNEKSARNGSRRWVAPRTRDSSHSSR